ncbi:MAG: hypothetical protein FWB85_08905 [Chitinispirillia bacterium]|nr:hypothetical protein [Chitinispirillia bacterium]MCL2242343.1 hypothetical protein [Chitinispirillia bacterium]
MITIKNNNLSAEIRNPGEDLEQLGTRYCHGGYIWQIYDREGRPLMSGPHYPDPCPIPFDGQGMPEAFKSPELVQPCHWDIDKGDDYAAMSTQQQSIKLRREVRIAGNRIESATSVENISGDDVPILWFSHPFFPLNPNLTCGKISPPVINLPQNAGYDIDDSGMIRMKPEYPWPKGLFQLIGVCEDKLTFEIPHPTAGQLILATDYPVAKCPVWANKNTFSFEPFIERTLHPSQKTAWTITLTAGNNRIAR